MMKIFNGNNQKKFIDNSQDKTMIIIAIDFIVRKKRVQS